MGALEVNEANFQAEILDAGVPAVVDFWAEWCGPCRRVEPIVQELADEYGGRVRFARFNVDEGSSVAARYSIMAIPTIILFKNGEIVDRLIGVRSKADYQSWIDSKI